MSDFSRMITLLRKEKGLSQKQVALELEVSQALLSHYEKGIRECGLDFVVKMADYYNVSCDYILGRTSERSSSNAVSYSLNGDIEKINIKNSAVLDSNKKMIVDSLEVVYGLLEQTGSKGLNAEVSSYLMVSIYKVIRILYSSNPKNPQAMFSIIPELYSGLSTALQSINESNAKNLSSGKNSDIKLAPSLSPEIISRYYGELSSSLYELIQRTEEKIKKLC